MNCLRGITAVKLKEALEEQGEDKLVEEMVKEAIGKKSCAVGDRLIVVHGINEEFSDEACIVRVISA